MNARTSVAALITAATVTLPATPALAGSDGSGSSGGSDVSAPSGCVTDAAYANLGVGQTLAHVRSVVDSSAMVSRRAWTSGAYAYKERVYAMCTPMDSAHAELTTRFMYYEGAWRAFIVDTLLGPEPR